MMNQDIIYCTISIVTVLHVIVCRLAEVNVYKNLDIKLWPSNP